MSTPPEDTFVAPASLASPDYLKQRLQPAPGDPLYLHLSDLKLALEQVLPAPGSRVLDYGCGGSPYRSLFQTDQYRRADLAGTPDIDFVFGEDSRIEAADSGFDCVLSTQVLEHVKNVPSYLGECRRLLRPGGQLLISTHGSFMDHGCPHDYWRWTADGLRTELTRAGFQANRILKLTTGPRALLFLNRQFHHRLLVGKRSLPAAALRLSRLVYSRLNPALLDELADREYAQCRMVAADMPQHEIYIALLAAGVKT